MDRAAEGGVSVPAGRAEAPGACPVCARRAGYRRAVGLSFGAISTCLHCRSGVLLPRRGPADLAALHGSDSYLAHPYFESRRAISAALRTTFDARLRVLAEHCGALPGKKLLDVGCDTGLFVQHARDEARMDAVGIDLSERVVARGRAAGLNILHGTLEDAALEDASFDVVCAFDLIEHVAEPRAWMAQAARVLKPGGVLIIETPNYHGLAYATGRCIAAVPGLRAALRPLLERLWPPFHVQYFTRDSLAALAGDSGLHAERVGTRELAAGETAVRGWLRPLILALFVLSRALARPTLILAVARKPLPGPA
jgi:SAM-dependent methyltransferase